MRAIHTQSLVITAIFVKVTLSDPKCTYPDDSETLMDWFSCGLDDSAWYGITKNKYTFAGAVDTCDSVGGELVYINSKTIDQCSFYATSLSGLYNDFILYSGRYFAALDEWAWCPEYLPGTQIEDGCQSKMEGYLNWMEADRSEGDCMGGLINGGFGSTFYDYGWVKRSCSYLDNQKVHGLCRLDCGDIEPNVAQSLMYSRF